MAPSPDVHSLTSADLSALAAGEFPPEIIRRLRAAELSKHALLIEALRRAARGQARDDAVEAIEAACGILSEVQARAPELAAEVLTLPHVGFWAADCLSRLRPGPAGQPGSARPPSSLDLAHLASFAAAAALRAAYPFELRVPVRGGVVTLPTVGTACIDGGGMPGWARIRLDRLGATVMSGSGMVDLPVGHGRGSRTAVPGWVPLSRLRAETDGIALSVILETSDPFLTRLAPPVAEYPRVSSEDWQQRINAAWRILVRDHRPTADGLAAALTTLVPLREPATGRPVSATSGWAWGAIALSLPPDAPALAETLVHEFQHLVLSAVEDLVPLADSGDDRLHYAPWRDDPRPAPALLQGTYAQLGVTGFWRRQRQVGSPEHRLRSEVEFARGRRHVFEGVRTLTDSSALTAAGRVFIAEMSARLADWQGEPVPVRAETMAAEMGAEHRLRWQLAHLRPDAEEP